MSFVLELRDGTIAAMTSFVTPALFRVFGLPGVLPAGDAGAAVE